MFVGNLDFNLAVVIVDSSIFVTTHKIIELKSLQSDLISVLTLYLQEKDQGFQGLDLEFGKE